jgi:hypothetical protein
VLAVLAIPDGKLPQEDEVRKVSRASEAVKGLLPTAIDVLIKARTLRDNRGDAATEVFRAISDCLPPGEVPDKNFGDGERERFIAGYDTQLAAYKKKFIFLLE